LHQDSGTETREAMARPGVSLVLSTAVRAERKEQTMSAVINADRSMTFATQAQVNDKHAAPFGMPNSFMEPSVNTMIDRKPHLIPVAHHHRIGDDDLPSNVQGRFPAAQSWPNAASFPNAFAFPDNPLRSAEDYLFRWR
jgi:hypothetical protein